MGHVVTGGTRKSIHLPQSRVLHKKLLMERLRGMGGIGVYFQPWDFDFLSAPVHVPGGSILSYVEVTGVREDHSNRDKGTYYPYLG